MQGEVSEVVLREHLLYGLRESTGATDAQLGMVCSKILLDLAVADMIEEIEADAAA